MIVGFAFFFHNFSTFRGQPGIYLEDLFVRPEFRGQGYGKSLLAALAKLAIERNCASSGVGRAELEHAVDRVLQESCAQPQNEWTVYRLTGAAAGKAGECETENAEHESTRMNTNLHESRNTLDFVFIREDSCRFVEIRVLHFFDLIHTATKTNAQRLARAGRSRS